jgi:sarcosine oxidase, subunit beta
MHADIVVVGGGVIGASVAYHLGAAGGRRVVLYEQAPPPGTGATAYSGGLVRVHHGGRMEMAVLAAASHPTYAHWDRIVGGDCGFRRTGFIHLVAPAGAGELGAAVAGLRGLGVEAHLMTPEGLGRLQPEWCLEGVAAGLYEPGGGYAEPRLAAAGFLRRACELGVEVCDGVAVTRICGDPGRVSGVDTEVGRTEAGTVVLAAGGWSRALALRLGLDLPLACRQIAVTLVRAPADTRSCVCIDEPLGTYFRPARQGVLFGVDTGNPRVAPEARVPGPGAGRLRAARGRLARRLPGLADAPFAGLRSGFDAFTPDERPLIGPVAGLDGLYLATGFSGGGFKTAPAVGQAVAHELVDGERAPQLDPFRLDRLQT